MSRHGEITLLFADGEYRFRLGLKEIEELEDKLKIGLFMLAALLGSPGGRGPGILVIRETVRLGLIGGGMTPTDALVLVRRYVDERPADENCSVAYAIALAGLQRRDPTKRAAGAEA